MDAATDREVKLAKSFEDPGIGELLTTLGAEPEPISLVEETAQAVHELVAGEAAIDLGDAFTASADESFQDLPIPDDALTPPAPAESSVPRPLPQTTNPNPDPLERSLLLQVPSDAVEEPAAHLSIEGHEEQAGEISALYSMSDRLFDLVACERGFDDLVESGMRAVMAGVDAQAGSVLELDHEREDFFFRSSAGGSSVDQLKAFRVPLTKGIVGHVAESGQALLIRDLSQDVMQMRAISLSVGFEARTCMAAPIMVGGQPYGVIEVFNRRDGGLFDERDLRSLEDGVRMFSKVLEVRFLLAELARRGGKR